MRKQALLCPLVLFSACASFTPQLGFKEVNDAVSARTGSTLHWSAAPEKNEEAGKALDQLFDAPLTAESAMQIALLNNNALQATYQELGIAQADLVEAGLLPNFIFGGEIRFPEEGVNFELSIVQSFIQVLQIPLRKKIAESRFEETKLSLIEKALALAYTVRRAYFEYQSEEHLLDLSNTAMLAIEASRDLSRRMHSAGNITDLDLVQAELNYETLKLEIAAHEAKVAIGRERLNALLNAGPKHLDWKISPKLPEPRESNFDIAALESETLFNSLPLAKISQKLVTLSATLDDAEKFRLFGETELGLSAAKEPGGKWGFGPAFSFPLPFFNQGEASIYRTHSELEQQHRMALDTTSKIQANLRSVWKRLTITEARLETYRKSILPLHERLVSESQKQFNSMLIGAFQLLEAKQNQISAQKDYVSELKNYWLLRTELDAARDGVLPTAGEE